MRKLFFLFLFLFFSTKLFTQEPEAPTPFKTLEYMFITSPEEEIESFINKTVRLAAQISGTIPSMFWIQNDGMIKENGFSEQIDVNQDFLTKIIIGFLISAVPAEIFRAIINRYIKRKIYFDHFKKFILSWPNIREQDDSYNQIPTILYNIFDYIHERYTISQSDRYLTRICPIILDDVQQIIYDYFPEKYLTRQKKYNFIFSCLHLIKRSIFSFGCALGGAIGINELEVFEREKQPVKERKNIEEEEIKKTETKKRMREDENKIEEEKEKLEETLDKILEEIKEGNL
jgi:hypothetical protein